MGKRRNLIGEIVVVLRELLDLVVKAHIVLLHLVYSKKKSIPIAFNQKVLL